MKNLAYLILGGLFISSCKDEVDVNADWKDVTVVYGLLAKSDSVHYVKVNKAFLGEGSAIQMAQIEDSSNYDQAIVTIQKYENGVASTAPIITLRDTVISDKASGVFYAPDQKLYYFKENLNANAEYKLEVKVGEKIASAKTPIINTFNLSGGSVFGNSVAPVGFYTGTKYADQNYTWQSVKNGKAYQLVLIFNYDEHMVDSSVVSKSFQWVFPELTSFNVLGGQSFTQQIEGESFYQQIASFIKPISESSGVLYRKFINISFRMDIAGDELNTYLEVNKPSTGLVFEKPEYTNIDNGIGIFSSRLNVYSTYAKNLSDASLNHLYGGSYTKDLGFCATSGIYACP